MLFENILYIIKNIIGGISNSFNSCYRNCHDECLNEENCIRYQVVNETWSGMPYHRISRM